MTNRSWGSSWGRCWNSTGTRWCARATAAKRWPGFGVERFDVVLTDLRMPEVDGLAVLRAAKARPGPPEVIVMTAYGTAESAVQAMKDGAADYLVKPFSMDELRLRVQRLATQRRAQAESEELVARLTPDMVAASAGMQTTLAAARQVAATDATVLLLGESGTGKSQLARYIHYQGSRARAPFVEVHCAALPRDPARGRALRTRAGRVHGRAPTQAGSPRGRATAAPSSWTRSAR